MAKKTLLITSTALTMAFSTAWADDNVVYLSQTANGGGNSALIEQDGTGNNTNLIQVGSMNNAGITQ